MYLAALGNTIEAQLRLDSVHLFIVPLFHANSWIFPYAVTAVAGMPLVKLLCFLTICFAMFVFYVCFVLFVVGNGREEEA